MRARLALVVLVLALAAGVRGLRGGDPLGAEAIWRWAQEEGGADLTAPAYLDAAREMARVRPWQEGYPTFQERLRAIEDARRAELAR